MTVEADGYVVSPEEWQYDLYRMADEVKVDNKHKVLLTAIPYYVWGNRGLNSMRVWIPET
jgi:DUF1680 family protein